MLLRVGKTVEEENSAIGVVRNSQRNPHAKLLNVDQLASLVFSVEKVNDLTGLTVAIKDEP